MATKVIKDLRRNDQRGNTQAGGPFWITSAEIDKSCDDLGALLFTFPKAGQKVFIHQAFVEISDPFAGDGTEALIVGSCTLATDDVTTGGDLTIVDADDYFAAADITEGTAGLYPAINSDLGVAIIANTAPADARLITGAATTVPGIYAELTSDNVITGGKCRVKMLVSVIDDI